MERKILFLVIPVFTLLIAAGIFFLFLKDDGQGGPSRTEAVTQPEEQEEKSEEPAPDDMLDEVSAREVLPPTEDFSDEMAGMPLTYRKAMGGFKGRVVEENGTPVPGIEVEIFGGNILDFIHDVEVFMGDDSFPIKLRTAETITNEDGAFYLKGVFPRAYYALAIGTDGARSFGRIIDTLPGPGEVVDLGDIVLPPFAVLLGKVIDEKGAPVAGARVRATNLPPLIFLSGIQDYRQDCSFLLQDRSKGTVIRPPQAFHRIYERLPIPATHTAQDGFFRLEGVPLGLVNVVFDRPGYMTIRQGPVSTSKGGERNLGNVILGRGAVIKGKVKDASGKPVPGVEVRLGSMCGFKEFTVLQPGVTTDDRGVFSQAGFSSTQAMAAARRYPEDPWLIVGPFNPTVEEPELTLPPSHDLRVVAVHDDGSPVKDVRLKIRPIDPMKELIFMTPPVVPQNRMRRLEDGVIEVQGLTQGRYDLLVTAPGCAVSHEKVILEEEAVEKKIVLQAALSVRVKVLTAEDESPVEWAEVYTSTDEDDWAVNPTRVCRSRTDDQGEAILKKLHPGKYTLTVSHPGYAITLDTLEVPADEEKVVLLQPGGAVEGVVMGGWQSSQPPYMVVLEPRGGRRQSIEAQSPRLTVTDLEGKFKVTSMSPGSWRVHVEHRLFDKDPSGLIEAVDMRTLKRETVEVVSGETAFVEIVLGTEETGPGAEVSGRVTIDGAPASGAVVSGWSKRSYQATVDSSGRYNLGKMPVGNCTLNISNLPSAVGLLECRVSRRITVVENMPLYEDFNLLTGSITGRLICVEGEIGAHQIRLTSDDKDSPYRVSMSTVTDLAGNFTFEMVPIGIYTLTSGERDILFEAVRGIKVLPGSRTGPLIIKQLTPVLVAGKVVLPKIVETPRYLMLWCLTKGKGNQNGVVVEVSQETGAFESRNLIVGSYSAILYGFQDVKFKPIDFEVPPGGHANLILTPEVADE